jgi:hypothetical protein
VEALAGIAFLAMIVCLVVVLYRAIRRRPWRRWGIAAAASLVLMVVFAILAGPPQEVSEKDAVEETTPEETALEETTPEPEKKAEPEPEKKVEPEPEKKVEPAPPPQKVLTKEGVEPQPDGSCPAGYPIKGNVAESGELIYHPPRGQFYEKTKAERCFASRSDAQNEGFRASKK